MTHSEDPAMPDVTYRPFRPDVAATVRRIIGEAFFIHRYLRSPRLLRSGLEVYLRGCLQGSTFTRVAVRDGGVIGVIMGRVAGGRGVGGARNVVGMWWHMARLAVLGFRERRAIREYLMFGPIYRRLRARGAATLTEELTLFAVAEAARGAGAGGALYGAFLDYLREHDRSDFYLYTDSLCTVGFYENRGMVRAAEEPCTVHLDGEPAVMDVYLYTGTAG